MPTQIATVLFAVGIAGLFWLDRDKSARTSKALWLPLIWLSIAGSRSVSAWLGMNVPKEIPGQVPPSSSLDQFIAAALMLLGLITLILRRRNVMSLFKANWPIMLYFSFCLVSLAWSDFPSWGFKRWVRALGDLIMVLIVASEAQPTAAFRRLFARVGFVLLPASVLLIKYYPELGQDFDAFGYRQYIGVATGKNVLGDLVFLMGLGALWQILTLVRDKEQPNRARRLLAQCTLLAFGIEILFTAHCATAGGCFTLGVGLMLAASLRLIRGRPGAVHALVLTILLTGGLIELFGGRAAITQAMGRKPDLTGRTEIWGILIPMAPNLIGGAGFETFWLGPRVAKIFEKVGGPQMTNESHNGYIEVYLNLGLLGVGLIALILGQGYRRTVAAFRHDPALGGLLISYVVTAAAYSLTEAGFRMLGLEWFFLLLSIVTASSVISLAEPASELGRKIASPDTPPGQFGYARTQPGLRGETKPLFPRMP
ncbi:MAG TPA: O-antigen ligase family protein [Candidatus Acidoferrum sp.]|nr:O-antigen ligase family protein [Candidatus Acidoferrum sp.]